MGGGRSECVPTAMMRCAKIEPGLVEPARDDAMGSSGIVGTLSRARGCSLALRLVAESLAVPSAGWERGRGTAGRLPVAVSVVLKAPASLASASPMARKDSLPESAAATASREDVEAS